MLALNETFQLTAGRMVLLGEPGAGKSTAAQVLVAELLALARVDPEAAVPLLIPLASWAPSESTLFGRRREFEIEDWLASRLAREVGITPGEARDVLPMIVPILDGLDEVSQSQRTECAQGIARFVEVFPAAPIVVCCRAAEFDLLPDGLLDSLPTFELSGLTNTDLATYFGRLEGLHWTPVCTEVLRDGSFLPDALSTPLMVTVAVDTWSDRDPTQLVELARTATSKEALREVLWGQWVARASRRASPNAVSLARGLAAGAARTGTAEIRVAELGSDGTRWAWFFAWASIVSAVSAAGVTFGAVLGGFMAYLIPILDSSTSRIARSKSTSSLLFLLGLVGLMPLFYFAGSLFAPWWVCAAASFGLGAAAALSSAPFVPDPKRTRPAEPLRAWLDNALAGAIVAIAWMAIATVVLRLPWGIAALLSLGAGASFGLDYAGHHLLARASLRFRSRKGPLPNRISDLVDAGFLRRTSDAHRFFHLELQKHLVTAGGPRELVCLENVGTDVLFRLATDRMATADHAEMVAHWDRVLRRDPANYPAVMHRANALHSAKQFDAAAKGYAHAASLSRRSVLPLILAAGNYRLLGDRKAALAAVSKALSLAPRSAGAHAELGVLQRNEGDLEKSLASFDEALGFDPDHTFSRRGRAETLRMLSRFGEAEADFTVALATLPDDPLSLRGRAFARARGNDLTGALADAAQLRELGQQDEALDQLLSRLTEESVANDP